MKVVSVVGARPQFVKAAAISRRLRQRHTEVLLHTGQHYDYEMSGIFFNGLHLPDPDVNLEVGSASHGCQTGAMLEGIERVLQREKPDCVLIYGDTNSTLAGALAAAKLRMPIVHVEAGLRSFNRNMPEEINRVVADHLSDLLLCPSDAAVNSLNAEGIRKGVHLVGDVMLDVLKWARPLATSNELVLLNRLGLVKQGYIVATVHRSENTEIGTLTDILNGMNSVDGRIVFPVHPRTRSAIARSKVCLREDILTIDPLGYIDMISLLGAARLVLTDSGGLQKEAYWLGVPCVTMRNETEWVETIHAGWNVLVGAAPDNIVKGVRSSSPPHEHPPLYGDGRASEKCLGLLDRYGSQSTIQNS